MRGCLALLTKARLDDGGLGHLKAMRHIEIVIRNQERDIEERPRVRR